MPSNGLSNRRSTLKRPIVCKSKPRGDCGACEPSITSPQQLAHPGDDVQFELALICDPDPTHPDFELTAQGAYAPRTPPPILTPNTVAIWHFDAPTTIGEYVMKFQAQNATRCLFLFEINMQVVP